MASKHLNSILAAVALLLVLAVGLNAQVVSGRKSTVAARFVYYSWDIEDSGGKTTFTQAGFPVTGFVPLQENLELQFFATGSSNDVGTPTGDYSLSGAGDLRLQVNRSFADDRYLVSVGMTMPTGKRELNYDTDTTIINLLSENYLDFNMRRFGQGYGASLMLGTAMALGPVRTGLGVLYEYTGSFHPYEDLGKYNPGDFVRFSVSADRTSGRYMLYGDLAVTLYTPDRFEDKKVFKQAAQGVIRLGSRYRWSAYQTQASVSYLVRDRNTEYQPDETIAQQRQLFGDEFQASARFKWLFRKSWYVSPSVLVRAITDNEAGFGNSLLVGFGGAVGHSLGKHVRLNLGSQVFTGDADDGAIDVSGFQITASAATSF